MKCCLVCGSTDMAKSHLMPRALIHDIRAEAKHAIVVTRDRGSARQSQSGEWRDDILCKAHEAALSTADDYGIRFCRRIVPSAPVIDDIARRVVNKHPDRLIRFVHAVVWRYSAANRQAGRPLRLGPYFDRIQAHLFANGPALEGFVTEPNIALEGRLIRLATDPAHGWLDGRRFMAFYVGGLQFALKVDNRPMPTTTRHSLLASSDLYIAHMPASEMLDDPGLLAVARAGITGQPD